MSAKNDVRHIRVDRYLFLSVTLTYALTILTKSVSDDMAVIWIGAASWWRETPEIKIIFYIRISIQQIIAGLTRGAAEVCNEVSLSLFQLITTLVWVWGRAENWLDLYTIFGCAAPQLGLAQTVTILAEAKVINSIANVFDSVWMVLRIYFFMEFSGLLTLMERYSDELEVG